MSTVYFSHNQIGKLAIDNGIDDAAWGYNLNTATFPTYGGEVIQILSVYIDDLTLLGTCATYHQAEAIYEFFASYLQVATQGRNPTPNLGDNVGGTAYNLYPVYFSYPERNWYFKIYPLSAPGFHYGREVVTPTWELTAHVIDDSPDLDLIKDGIKALATTKLVDGGMFSINGEISPQSGNPDTDPFQTFTSGISQQQQIIQKYSDYYNSLIPAYQKGDFGALTAGIGSFPNTGQTNPASTSGPGSVTIPKQPKQSGSNNTGSQTAPLDVAGAVGV